VRELVRRIPDLKEPLEPAGWQDDAPDGRERHEARTATRPARWTPPRFGRRSPTHAEQQAGSGARLIIVVDQFEEVFTLAGTASGTSTSRRCGRRAHRRTLLPPPRPWWSLACARIFTKGCLDDPTLAEALQGASDGAGAMTDEELHEAVIRPARSAGLRVEPGAGGAAAATTPGCAFRGAQTDAGVLPLLSHALTATWGKRKRAR